MPEGGNAKLNVVRRGGFADSLRPYKIYVNDALVGTIKKNSVLNVDVSSGNLRVEARIDWGRSDPITVTAPPGGTVEVEVSNHWGALLSLWAATFGSGTYLDMKQVRAS